MCKETFSKFLAFENFLLYGNMKAYP